MDTQFVVVSALSTLDEFICIVSEQSAASCFLVKDINRIIGVITKDSVLKIIGQVGKPIKLDDIANKDFITVEEKTTLPDVIARMQSSQVSVALVIHGTGSASVDDVKGLITKQQIADVIVQTMDMFSDYQR